MMTGRTAWMIKAETAKKRNKRKENKNGNLVDNKK